MARRISAQLCFLVFAAVIVLTFGLSAAAQQPAPQERIAELKQSIQQGHTQLRNYEWIETTTVMLKGEVKSQKLNRCYYGADGKIQKVPVSEMPIQQPSGGRLKKKIIAKKKEEMTAYMQRAVSLIQQYVPLDSGMVQSAKDNGKATYDVFEPNKVIRLNLTDFVKPGDLLTATFDIKANALLDIDVSTYVEDAKDGVTLNVKFARLPDGTGYAGQTTLDAKEKNIKVVVENTGHRKLN